MHSNAIRHEPIVYHKHARFPHSFTCRCMYSFIRLHAHPPSCMQPTPPPHTLSLTLCDMNALRAAFMSTPAEGWAPGAPRRWLLKSITGTADLCWSDVPAVSCPPFDFLVVSCRISSISSLTARLRFSLAVAAEVVGDATRHGMQSISVPGRAGSQA